MWLVHSISPPLARQYLFQSEYNIKASLDKTTTIAFTLDADLGGFENNAITDFTVGTQH